MMCSLRPTALVLAVLIASPAFAQNDRAPDDEAEGVIERDGDVFRFRLPDLDRLRWHDGDGPFRADTVIDGRRVIRFRLPDGEGEAFSFEVPEFDAEGLDRLDLPEFEVFREGGEPFGLARFHERLDALRGGLSEETRRSMRELEARAHELAREARRGDDREAAERALNEVLDELFEVRGRMREEQAAHLEAEADRLREEAEALRESLREREDARRALIEQRKRELLGEPGTGW